MLEDKKKMEMLMRCLGKEFKREMVEEVAGSIKF